MVFTDSLPEEIDLSLSLSEGTALLPTISVKVHAGEKSGYCRGVISWASQFNLISEKCRQQFNLPLIGGETPLVYGVGKSAIEILGKSYIKFSSRTNEGQSIMLQVNVVRKTNKAVTPAKLHPMLRENLKQTELADPSFDEPGDIDLVLGATFCPMVLKGGRHNIIPGTNCVALESIFGWILMGKAPLESFQGFEQNELSTK